MGNARARGTYEQRKAAATHKDQPAELLPSATRLLVSIDEWRAEKTADGGAQRKRKASMTGIRKSADGRYYRWDGTSLRRVSADEAEAAEATGAA